MSTRRILNSARCSALLVVVSTLALALSGCLGNGGTGARGVRHQTRLAPTNASGVQNPSVPPRATPNRPGSIPANAAIQRLNPDWVFVGHSTLDHVIREEFGITGSNREPAREQEILAEFNARRLDLGGNNYAMGVSSSLGPEPSKFRALAELLSSACGVAMRDPSVRSRFFPEVNHSDILVNSASAYDVAFLRLLGRYPEAAERGILVSMVNDLRAQGVSLESQLMGVCAVILNSLEFTHGR